MNRVRLYSIITLMSLALMGIVSIQINLLQRSLSANEANFAAGVNDALHETVSQLEARRMKMHIIDLNESIHVIRRSQPGERLEEEVVLQDRRANVRIKADTQITMMAGAEFSETRQYEFLDSLNVTVETDSTRVTESTGTVIWMSGTTSGLEEDQSLRVELQGDPEYVQIMQSTLRKLEGMEGNEFARVDTVLVQNILNETLLDQGIDLHYDIQLDYPGSEVQNIFVEESSLGQEEIAVHQVALFPNARSVNPQILSITFPNQESFLWKSIWREAMGSFIFSGIILFCFGWTIKTIFRQKRLSEMKNDFINNMTHELKTPIATISLAAETLSQQRNQLDPEFVDRYTGIIQEENSRINRQVERVLQAAQFDRNEIQLEKKPVNVNELLQKAVAHIQLVVENRGGTLTRESQGNPVIDADAQHLANVISNLLDNANKYSPDTPHISIKSEVGSDQVKIQVSDQGKGIPVSMQEDIFTRFYRVSTGDLHEVKGFGLGLSYVKEVVEAHGGSISVKSKPGKGSTFTIALPISSNTQGS